MTPFEHELKQALKRQEPPAGFSERLFAKLKEEESAKRTPWWRRLLKWPPDTAPLVALACALTLVTSMSILYEERQRVDQGERAKQKVLLALKITSAKLRATQRQVREVESAGQQ